MWPRQLGPCLNKMNTDREQPLSRVGRDSVDPSADCLHPPARDVGEAIEEPPRPDLTFDPVVALLEAFVGKKGVDIQVTEDIGCTEATKAKHEDKLTAPILVLLTEASLSSRTATLATSVHFPAWS